MINIQINNAAIMEIYESTDSGKKRAFPVNQMSIVQILMEVNNCARFKNADQIWRYCLHSVLLSFDWSHASLIYLIILLYLLCIYLAV